MIYIYNKMSQFTTSTMKTSASELKEPENLILRNQIGINEIMEQMNELKRKYPKTFMSGGKTQRNRRRRNRRSLKRKHNRRR